VNTHTHTHTHTHHNSFTVYFTCRFISAVTGITVAWWGFCGEHRNILAVDSRVFTLALPFTSSTLIVVPRVWSVGVKRARGFSLASRASPCQPSIDSAPLRVKAAINMSITGAVRGAAATSAPVSSYLVPVFVHFKHVISLASTTQGAHTVVAGQRGPPLHVHWGFLSETPTSASTEQLS